MYSVARPSATQGRCSYPFEACWEFHKQGAVYSQPNFIDRRPCRNSINPVSPGESETSIG